MILFLALVLFLSACCVEPTQPTQTQPTIPEQTQPKFEYTVVKETFYYPSMVHPSTEREVFQVANDHADMYVFTTYWQEAERFADLQLTLLEHLRQYGVKIPQLAYIGTDYNGSFSNESRSQVYISLNDMGCWQQILATLQGIWGDYTDYGYLYAVSNAFAVELGWITDTTIITSDEQLNTYFTANPYALNLQYPSFTERYASEETVHFCKALSQRLIKQSYLRSLVSQPIETQLEAYRNLIANYAADLQVDYDRNNEAYSFYAEAIPLRIKTEYAVLLVEETYKEPYPEIHGDYFSTDRLIYQTATELTGHMADAVSYVGLEGQVEPFTLYWMSQESGTEKYGGTYFRLKNHWTLNSAYTGTIYFAMHAYYRHLEHMITGTTSSKWQSMAFAECGNFRHPYAKKQNDHYCTNVDAYVDLFRQYTGRDYMLNGVDCYLIYDILAYINGSTTGDAASSVSCARYLMRELGEETVMELLLNPKQVEDVAGRNWTSIEKEWKQYLSDLFSSVSVE